MQFVLFGFVFLYLLVVEALDWQGRFEIIKTKVPWLWKAMDNRPARLVLLLVCAVYLVKEFDDPAPPVIRIQRPPDSVIVAQPQPEPKEPPDSLRRRTFRLADDAEAFWNDRNAHHPPHSNGVANATGDQKRINDESDRYDGESASMCLAKFESRTRGIIEELKAKGVDLGPSPASGFFEAYLQQKRCLDPYQIPFLRQLAYHVDAFDKLVVIEP